MLGRRLARHMPNADSRLTAAAVIFAIIGSLVILRLGYLQIAQYGMYAFLASDQHDIEKKLLPTRGQILVRDRADGSLHPLASNRLAYQVYAVPRDMKDIATEGHALASALLLDDAATMAKLTRRPDSQYELLAKDVDPSVVDALQAQNLSGVGFLKTTVRLYPEKGIGGQLLGFVAQDAASGPRGQYGIEGAFDKVLAGTAGELVAEKDASGRRLTIGNSEITEAVDGSDVILTVDRTIQYQACDIISRAVTKYGADAGSLIVIDPATGAVLALCSAPDFDPSEYNKIKDIKTLGNPAILNAYEPGSVFKAVTIAAGLDADKITPKTTYVDMGVEKIDDFEIRNADKKAHGVQTMIDVLDESLNTGTIFVQRLLGKDAFRKYVEAFGFGKKTNLGLSPEAKGNTAPLANKGDVFAATASFGQGISMTPIQLTAAYAALGNGGKLFHPYIVEEIVHPDGTREKTKPFETGHPISSRASHLISGMLVSVVENGHGKRAKVPGYWVAGKTGTAQVAKPNGRGYEADITIGSFAGYAPADDPKFVMLVKIDHPRDVQWAESSAAPVFGEMAKFLLTYLEVPPDRPIGKNEAVAATSTKP